MGRREGTPGPGQRELSKYPPLTPHPPRSLCTVSATSAACSAPRSASISASSSAMAASRALVFSVVSSWRA